MTLKQDTFAATLLLLVVLGILAYGLSELLRRQEK